MRRLILPLGVIILASALGRADTLQYNFSGQFDPSASCTTNCTQLSVHVAFQWDPSTFCMGGGSTPMVPGSLNIETSAFMGTFSGNGFAACSAPDTIRLSNLLGDELDLDPFGAGSMFLFTCGSQACQDSFAPLGQIGFINATSFSLTSATVGASESSSLTLLMSGLGAVAFLGRRRLLRPGRS